VVLTVLGKSWVGGATGDWNTTSNWAGNSLPGSTEYAIVPSGVTVTHSSGTHTVAGITGGGNLTVSGCTLNAIGSTSGSALLGAVAVNALNNFVSSTLNFSTGAGVTLASLALSSLAVGTQATLGGSDTVTVTGTTSTNTSGASQGGSITMTGSGRTIAQGVLTLGAQNGAVNLSAGRILENAGTATFNTSESPISLSGGASIINDLGATWKQSSGATISSGTGGGTFTNQGTFNSTGGTNTVGVAFNNTGTVSVNSNTLNLTGTITQYSSTTLSSGIWIANSATLVFPSGSNLTTIASGSSVTLSGASSSFAKLTGSGTSNAGTLTIANRTFTAPAGFGSTGTLNLQSSATFIMQSDFTKQGTLTIDSTSKLQSGLANQVSLWSAEGNGNDSVGTSNGTLQSGVTATAAGREGRTFSFDGTSNAIVDLPGTSTGPLDITGNQLTIETWVFQTNASQSGNDCNAQMIFAKVDNSGVVGYQMTAGSVHIATTNNPNFTLSYPSAFPLNTWMHAAVTYDGSMVRLYLDGVQVASAALTGTIIHAAPAASIGNATADHGFGFKGRIDEVSVYNRGLTASEIASIASADRFTQTAGITDLSTGGILHGGIEVQGGTLKGTGTVRGDVENSAIVAPGNSPGIITIDGNYTQSSGGTLNIEIAGTNPSTPDFDRLIVNGTVSLAGALSATLFGGFTPSAGNSFKTIDKDGSDAVAGTFTGLGQDATFGLGGYTFQISYTGGTGNDGALAVIGVPVTWDGGASTLS